MRINISESFEGLLLFILLECINASFLPSSGLFDIQWLSPLGTSTYFILSFMDLILLFVSIPILIHLFLMVSFEREFSRSIRLKLLPF